ncbi:MAG: type II secretion system protein [Planctomycetota bacterium]|nr:type II secretion system protein [Planctomycetota bacterium]
MNNIRHISTASRRAFTLLELVVVIGIILVLIGLVLAVSGSLLAGAEKRQLEQSFSVIDAAVQEWQQEMGREITFRRTLVVTGFTTDPTTLDQDGNPNTPLILLGYDVVEMANPDQQSQVFLLALTGLERPREILANLPEKTLRTIGTTTTQELIDPWGKPIRIVFPGRVVGTGTGPDTGVRDQDSSVRSSQEVALGSCLDRRIRFVSSGPDGVFGSIGTAQFEDNVESYTTR